LCLEYKKKGFGVKKNFFWVVCGVRRGGAAAGLRQPPRRFLGLFEMFFSEEQWERERNRRERKDLLK
jgi:hypothetical protein